MSDLIAAWNGWADAWLLWVVERSCAAALAFVAVGLVLLLVRRRVSAHAPSHLLLLPGLLFVLPIERALPNDLRGLVPAPQALLGSREPALASQPPQTPAREARAAAVAPHAEPGAAATSRRAAPSGAALPFSAWCVGVLSYALWLAYAHQRAARRLAARGRLPDPALHALFKQLCSERGFDAPIALRTVAGLTSPIATGLVRRAVWVPEGLERQLAPEQLRFVLLHELEHHARRDVSAEALLLLVRAAYCWHPVAWLTLALHRHWREYACDEAALARAGAQARAPLAEALFTLFRLAHDTPRPPGATATLITRNPVMKTRLVRILDRTRVPRRSLTAAGLLLLAGPGLGVLTLARAQTPTPQTPRQESGARQQTPKPSGEVAVAIDEGIAWLLAKQAEDGRWDIGPDPAPNTPRDHNEAHVTALALRAVLHGAKGPRHAQVVRALERGDRYLRTKQDERGLFGGGEPLAEAYGHAQVLRTLCAIERVMPAPDRLTAITRGVAYAEHARNPYSGWRYHARSNDNDSKHTALMLLALVEARALGVPVAPQALAEARGLLDQLTDPVTGRTGFVTRGTAMSRFTTKAKRFPSAYSEEPTAMRILVEVALGDGAADLQTLAIDVVRQVPPRWSPKDGTTDFAYWCFGAQAMAAVGGEPAETWRKALHDTLLGSRIVGPDGAHWPADDAWGRPGMEAYSTASAVLALHALH